MARYIDADALYKATQKRIAEANEARMAVVDDEFLDLINDALTEDVAPRAEVERLTVELQAMLGAANSYKMHYENLAKEIFGEIEKCMLHDLIPSIGVYKGSLELRIAELKKKYTEAEAEPPKESKR